MTSETEGFVVIDIASYFTNELYSGVEIQRGSILVEVKCTVKNL
jgi:hypothetical protein